MLHLLASVEKHSHEWWLLRDLSRVGPKKPVGYLPVSAIIGMGREPAKLLTEAHSRGLRARMFTEYEAPLIGSGALFLWHEATLASLLMKHSDLLPQRWVDDPEAFVAHIAAEYFPETDPLWDVISEAFGSRARRNADLSPLRS